MPSQSSPPIYNLPGFYEPFSVLSHLAGAVLFLVLGARLLKRGRGDSLRRTVLGIYVGSSVFLFVMSGVYHMMVADSPARGVMARLDHSAIFALIAGTFTPVHGILFQGWSRWAPLTLIWAVAIAGITLKNVYFDSFAEWLGISLYLLLGWLGALSGASVALRYGFAFVKPLLWGGIAYSAGAVLEFMRWPYIIPGVVHPHELFHLAVLIGALFHWSFVWRIAVLPSRPDEHPDRPLAL
ncbi:MAG: hemolysin III family protein [Pirellulales bacterium]